MKIMTIIGTRPEICRLNLILKKLDARCDSHVIIHTGQSFDPLMNDIFFQQFDLRKPDCWLGVEGSFVKQVAMIFGGVEGAINEFKPDKFFVLGDTNSSLGALVARRMHIPVYHMEAGNRCFNPQSPEEINRRVIDHCSSVHLCYTERSAAYLADEGIRRNVIYVVGNPMLEVIRTYESSILYNSVLKNYNLNPKQYVLASFHREENVDSEPRLRWILEELVKVSTMLGIPVVAPCHPRTAKRIREFGLQDVGKGSVILTEPGAGSGYFGFACLTANARLVISDSGTGPEESIMFGVPCIILRDSTERMETVESGGVIISGIMKTGLDKLTKALLSAHKPLLPPEYEKLNVSDTVVNILMSSHLGESR